MKDDPAGSRLERSVVGVEEESRSARWWALGRQISAEIWMAVKTRMTTLFRKMSPYSAPGVAE